MTLKFNTTFFIFHESMGAVRSCISNADKRRIGIYQLVVSRKMMKRDGANLEKNYNFFLLNLFCSMKYSKSKSKPCRKHKKLAVSSRCVSSASCRAILTRQQLINLRNVSKYFHIFLLNKSKLNAREIFWKYFGFTF